MYFFIFFSLCTGSSPPDDVRDGRDDRFPFSAVCFPTPEICFPPFSVAALSPHAGDPIKSCDCDKLLLSPSEDPLGDPMDVVESLDLSECGDSTVDPPGECGDSAAGCADELGVSNPPAENVLTPATAAAPPELDGGDLARKNCLVLFPMLSPDVRPRRLCFSLAEGDAFTPSTSESADMDTPEKDRDCETCWCPPGPWC